VLPAVGVSDPAPVCAAETETERQMKMRIEESGAQSRVWKSEILATLVWRIIGFAH
jgi:hypothetical protein